MCEWLTRFEICARANAWTDERKALTLPTLLEGEALAVWLELNEADRTARLQGGEEEASRQAAAVWVCVTGRV